MSGKPSFNDIKHAMDVLAKLTPEARVALEKSVDGYKEGRLTGEKLKEVISKLC